VSVTLLIKKDGPLLHIDSFYIQEYCFTAQAEYSYFLFYFILFFIYLFIYFAYFRLKMFL